MTVAGIIAGALAYEIAFTNPVNVVAAAEIVAAPHIPWREKWRVYAHEKWMNDDIKRHRPIAYRKYPSYTRWENEVSNTNY